MEDRYMKRKEYIIPTVDIIELKRQTPLLAGSVLDSNNLNETEVDDAWSPEMELIGFDF
jgi:hypothetical protein